MTDPLPLANDTVGVLLAGGQSRRMGGGDKCLRSLGGVSLLARTVARARQQVSALVLSANGDPARFKGVGLPVVADSLPDYAGPLAGILAGLDWASAHAPEARWLASFATDAPFFPTDLVVRLATAVEHEGAEIACAMSGGRLHPVFALWPLGLADDLRRVLIQEGLRKVDLWIGRHRTARVDFPIDRIDPFLNLNTPEDFLDAARILSREA